MNKTIDATKLHEFFMNIGCDNPRFELLLLKYHSGDIIKRDDTAKYTRLDRKQVEAILNTLAKDGVLVRKKQYLCDSCGSIIPNFYDEDSDEFIFCDHCDNEVDSKSFHIVWEVV